MFSRLKIIARGLRRELRVYQLALRDPRTPRAAKVLLWLAIGYLLLPFDLVPDWLPVIGQLDDLLLVPGLLYLALRFIPPEVLADCRQQVESCAAARAQSPGPE